MHLLYPSGYYLTCFVERCRWGLLEPVPSHLLGSRGTHPGQVSGGSPHRQTDMLTSTGKPSVQPLCWTRTVLLTRPLCHIQVSKACYFQAQAPLHKRNKRSLIFPDEIAPGEQEMNHTVTMWCSLSLKNVRTDRSCGLI